MKKEVLFIIENLRDGGAEKALLSLLKSFDYKTYSVTLCVLFLDGIYWDEIPSEVKVIVLYNKNNSLRRKSFRYYKRYNFTFLLKCQIRRKTHKRYDTIVSFLEGRALLFHNFIRKRAKRNITWVHCDLPNYHWTIPSFFDISQELKCYSNMDEIVFVSFHAMESFLRVFHVDTPVRCIYNLIDSEMIKAKAGLCQLLRTCFTITAIGSLNKVKAFDKLIRVAKLARQDGYVLHIQIIGMGGEEDILKKMAKDYGVCDCVSFIGFKRNPYPYLRNSDICVSTSVSEGLPLVICEALVLGIPVVATRTAGALELLGNGEYGMLTEFDDTSIYQGIRTLIERKDLREKYAKKSVERAQIFDMESVINEIYDVILG